MPTELVEDGLILRSTLTGNDANVANVALMVFIFIMKRARRSKLN